MEENNFKPAPEFSDEYKRLTGKVECNDGKIRKNNDIGENIVSGIAWTIIILIFLSPLLHPLLLLTFHIGLPDQEFYKVALVKDKEHPSLSGYYDNNQTGSIIYCKDFREIVDPDSGKVSNDVVIATDVYEARPFCYIKTAHQKSFFGFKVLKVERWNVQDQYFVK